MRRRETYRRRRQSKEGNQMAPMDRQSGAATRYTGAFTIELTCRVCRKPYTPTPAEVRRGPTIYHRCPDCRAVDVAGETPGRIADG